MESTAASLEMMEVGEEALTATMVMEEERRAAEQKASEEKRGGLFNRAKKGLEMINPNITGICWLLNSTGMCVLCATQLCVSCVLHKVGMPVLLVVLFSGCACAVEA